MQSSPDIIKIYQDYMSKTRKQIVDLFNEHVNDVVVKYSKNVDFPIEVEYFPAKQLPKLSIELYKQILKAKGLDNRPPNKIFLSHNLNELLKSTAPILFKVMVDKKIVPVDQIRFKESLYYSATKPEKKQQKKTSLFDFLPRANKLSKDYSLSDEDALYIAVGEYMYQDDVMKHFWNNFKLYKLEGLSNDKAANKAFKKYMNWYKKM
jgi:hypothetical protein